MKENCLWYWQKKRQGKCRKDSPELKDALLRRMLPPNNESITKISREEGISEQTLRNWRDKARKEGYAAPGTDAVPDDWSTQDKFLVVVETASMNETELAEYARKKGLYIEQIKAWEDACMNANGGIAKEASRLNRELKDSEKERRKLEKELQRNGCRLGQKLCNAPGRTATSERNFSEASAPCAIRHASPKLVANSPSRIYGIFSKTSFLMSNVFFIVPAPSAWCDPPQHF